MPGSHALVGLYSQNCPEWILAEQACYTYSLVVVPLYDTLGPDACAFIINQAEINLVVCENDSKCNLLLDKAPRYVPFVGICSRSVILSNVKAFSCVKRIEDGTFQRVFDQTVIQVTIPITRERDSWVVAVAVCHESI